MKIKLKSLLLAAAAVTTFNSLADSDIPGFWQDTHEPWTAKFYYAPLNTTTPPDDWFALDFDDSSWETLQGPIYRGDGGGTKWVDYYSAYWLRSHFNLDDTEKLEWATLKVHHDDGCKVYLNGKMVYDIGNVISNPNEIYLEGSLFKKGENVIAVYVADTGGGDAFIDFGIDPLWNNPLEVEVSTPGTMGDIILAKVDDFSDVQSIRIWQTQCRRHGDLVSKAHQPTLP